MTMAAEQNPEHMFAVAGPSLADLFKVFHGSAPFQHTYTAFDSTAHADGMRRFNRCSSIDRTEAGPGAAEPDHGVEHRRHLKENQNGPMAALLTAGTRNSRPQTTSSAATANRNSAVDGSLPAGNSGKARHARAGQRTSGKP